MPSYLLDRITMGTIISFRYKKSPFEASSPGSGQFLGGVSSTFPGAAGQHSRTIMVLTTNWLGNLHGIKVSALTPMEQEYIQDIFNQIYSQNSNIYESLESNIRIQKEQLQALHHQRSELLTQQQKIVVRPQAPGVMGMAGAAEQTGKNILGSVIGKINTFLPTQVQMTPMAQNPKIQQEIALNQQAANLKGQELNQFIMHLEHQKKLFAQIGKIPRDPYNMYHQVIKPMLGWRRLPNMYRKFRVQFINTPRIIKSPGVINDLRS